MLWRVVSLFISGIISLCIASPIEVYASPNKTTTIITETGSPRINYDILDSLCTVSVEAILREVKPKHKFIHDSLSTRLSVKPDDRAGLLLVSALQLKAKEYGLHLKNSTDSNSNFLMIIHKAGAYYTLLPTSSDSIVRTLSVQLRGWYKSEMIDHKPMVYADTIKRGSITYLEQIPGGRQFNPFIFGEVPPVPKTFWDDILEPLVVVVALATTITLLFTVRSQ